MARFRSDITRQKESAATTKNDATSFFKKGEGVVRVTVIFGNWTKKREVEEKWAFEREIGRVGRSPLSVGCTRLPEN